MNNNNSNKATGECKHADTYLCNKFTCDGVEFVHFYHCRNCEEAIKPQVSKCNCQYEKGHSIVCPLYKEISLEEAIKEAEQDLKDGNVVELNDYIKDQVPVEEWRLDLETEKLISGKNQHSVYHICPEHGVGINMPLQNKCVDCKLY